MVSLSIGTKGFPRFVPSVMAPPGLAFRPDFRYVEPSDDTVEVEARIERATRQAADDAYTSFLLQAVPERDLRYSHRLLQFDAEVQQATNGVWPRTPVEAMAYLVEKLLDHAQRHGSVPVVGRPYASDVIVRSLRGRQSTGLAPAAVVTSRQAVNLYAFAAGLSLSFLSEGDLISPSVDALLRFKEENGSLRERHHADLVEVAQRFTGLPDDSTFPEALAALRARAQAERISLDEQAKDAWRSAGLGLAEKALIAGTGGVVTALGLVGTASIPSLAAHAVPAVAAGLGVAAASAVGAFAKARAASRQKGVTYLLNARRFLARET